MDSSPPLTAPANVNEDPSAAFDWIVAWFVGEAWRHRTPQPLIAETCRRMAAAGVPIDTFTAWVQTLHPHYFGVGHRWVSGSNDIQSFQGSHDIWDQPILRDSPLQAIFQGASALRRRLCDPAWPRDFPVLDEYAEKGMTDYCAMALPSMGLRPHCISFSTARAGGFTTAELALVDRLLPYMARVTDVQALSYLATTLLDTYVGHQSGARILNGSIRRGSATTIHAVIWLSDLRNFTELSATLPGDEILDLLNAYFDCLGAAVEAAGGEILKFIGDSVLAIQPLTDPGSVAEACRRALDASAEARRRLATLNDERAADGKARFDFGLALHVGDVLYGNIGTQNRLDFTVIGPAVNEAARIEGLCSRLGEPILVSSRFAAAVPDMLEAVGRFELKGVAGAQEVFRPR